jgi:hypothetical protein
LGSFVYFTGRNCGLDRVQWKEKLFDLVGLGIRAESGRNNWGLDFSSPVFPIDHAGSDVFDGRAAASLRRVSGSNTNCSIRP